VTQWSDCKSVFYTSFGAKTCGELQAVSTRFLSLSHLAMNKHFVFAFVNIEFQGCYNTFWVPLNIHTSTRLMFCSFLPVYHHNTLFTAYNRTGRNLIGWSPVTERAKTSFHFSSSSFLLVFFQKVRYCGETSKSPSDVCSLFQIFCNVAGIPQEQPCHFYCWNRVRNAFHHILYLQNY
jgi:hypothetical protein